MNRVAIIALVTAIAPIGAFAAVPVTVVAVGDLLQQARHSAPATVIARNSPSLSAEINARIDSIPVKVGDTVEPGDLLAQLDCRQYDSLLAAAKAGMDQLASERDFSAAQLKRARGLKLKKGISDEGVEQRKSEWESYSARYRMHEETHRQAQLQVDRCQIHSPFRAVVVERLASSGSLATIATPILKLVQLDDIEISARLREQESETLEESKEIWFKFFNKRYRLTLRGILAVIDPRTRTREVRLRFAEESAPVGAAGRVLWQGESLQLPAGYLVRRSEQLGVFLVDDGQAKFQPVPDAVEGQPAVIDIPAERLLIVEGRQRLGDGDEISVQAQNDGSDAPSNPLE
jgi:RND family efflux transporter MFP subunit